MRYNSDGALVVINNSEGGGADPNTETIKDVIGNWESPTAGTTPAATDTIVGSLRLLLTFQENIESYATTLGDWLDGGSVVKPLVLGANGVSNSSITSGGSSQLVAALNNGRRYLEVINNSSGDLWLNFGASAGVDAGIPIPAGGSWFSPPNACPWTPIHIFGATTGQKFSWWEVAA